MTRRLFLHLTIPAVVASGLLLAVGVGAAGYVHSWQEQVSRGVRENVSAMRAAEELEIMIRELRTRLEHFRASGNGKHVEAVKGLREEIEEWMVEANRWSFSPREQELTGRAREGWERLGRELDRITEIPESLKEQDYELLEELLGRGILTPIHEFLDLNEEEVEQSVLENETSAKRLVFGLLIVGTCGAGAGLGMGYALARRFIERLQRSERAALHAEQLAALGHLAAGMAHELRNPLSTIKILVQGALTESQFGPSDGVLSFPASVLAGRDLSILEEEITRLERLVQSFLDFAGPPLPEKRVVDVCTIVRQTLDVIAGRASAAGVMVAFNHQANSIRIAVDPGQFRQVVLNLVLNAVDAVKAGGMVHVQLMQGRKGELTLRVADNGSGLPQKLGSQIFEPFTTTKETGLGLGLSICKRIMEAHGGTITAANRSQGGAEFVVRFPATIPKSEPQGAVSQ